MYLWTTRKLYSFLMYMIEWRRNRKWLSWASLSAMNQSPAKSQKAETQNCSINYFSNGAGANQRTLLLLGCESYCQYFHDSFKLSIFNFTLLLRQYTNLQTNSDMCSNVTTDFSLSKDMLSQICTSLMTSVIFPSSHSWRGLLSMFPVCPNDMNLKDNVIGQLLFKGRGLENSCCIVLL